MIGQKFKNIIISIIIGSQIFILKPTDTYHKFVGKHKNKKAKLINNKLQSNLTEQKFKQFKQQCAEIKDIREYEIKRQQELQRKRNKGIKYSSLSRGSNIEEVNLICTFYTASADEGSGTGLTASGKSVKRGMVAANSLKFGTQIYTKEYGVLTVEDRGNPSYIHQINDNTHRIDIYVESKEEAKKLGVQKIKGRIIK